MALRLRREYFSSLLKEYLERRIAERDIAMSELLLPLFIAGIAVCIAGFRIANQYERVVVFRLGRLLGVRGPGLYRIIP